MEQNMSISISITAIEILYCALEICVACSHPHPSLLHPSRPHLPASPMRMASWATAKLYPITFHASIPIVPCIVKLCLLDGNDVPNHMCISCEIPTCSSISWCIWPVTFELIEPKGRSTMTIITITSPSTIFFTSCRRHASLPTRWWRLIASGMSFTSDHLRPDPTRSS